MSNAAGTLLLVEDDPHDAFFFNRALQKTRPDIPLQIVTDGQQALDYLNGKLKYSDRAVYPMPSLILLDLKLPYLNGFEVLEQLGANPGLALVPVFVLTSSPEERDRRRAMELGAKGYFVKPPTPDMLKQVFAAVPGGGQPV